jgi:hypothetical protein
MNLLSSAHALLRFMAITISTPRTFQVSGVPAISIPAGAQEVRVAGGISYLIGNRLVFKVGSAVGKCGTGQPHKTHYRRFPGFPPLKEDIQFNRRGTAASIVLTMAEGHEFEARGYARNAEMTRYRFSNGTIAKV